MKDKICIIMADGKAKRMAGLNKKKQLIEINGEPIICHTIKQLRTLGIEPLIATHFEEFNFLDIQHIVPENNNHEIKKFNANKKYYQDYEETLFIWGDTYFEDCDIKEIVRTPVDSFKFFGNDYEIFGFKIKKPYYYLIDEGTNYIISKPNLDYGNTGTWGLLRYIGGHELLPNPLGPVDGVTSIHEPQKYVAEKLLQILPGLSMDCDGQEDIEIFAQRFPNLQIEELMYIDKNNKKYKFINRHWKEI